MKAPECSMTLSRSHSVSDVDLKFNPRQPGSTFCLSCNAVRFTRTFGMERTRKVVRDTLRAEKLFGKSKAAFFFPHCQNTWIKRESGKGVCHLDTTLMFIVNTCIFCRCAWLSGTMGTKLPKRKIHDPSFLAWTENQPHS